MSVSLIGLGSNLCDRQSHLLEALDRIQDHPQVEVRTRSRFHATAPVGGPEGQGEFLNAAAKLETRLSPGDLLKWMHSVEDAMGRRREIRWGPRAIDLDLLLYDKVILPERFIDGMTTGPPPIIPHPLMAMRRFVLAPAAEAAPDMVHSILGWTVQEMLDHLNNAANYVAITGPPGAGQSVLAERLADECNLILVEGEDSPRQGDMAIRDDWLTGQDPPPKLLIYLQAQGGSEDKFVVEQIKKWRRGPTLAVDAADLEQAFVLASAAITSMRPQDR